MGSLGKYVVDADPSTYGDADPDEIERSIVDKLNSDQRDVALRELRRVFPKDTSSIDDDTLHSYALKQAGVETPSASSGPERAKKLQELGAKKALVKAWTPLVFNAAVTQRSPRASDADKEAYAEAKESAISPRELNKPRVPSVDWETMKRMQEQNPDLHIVDVSDQSTFTGRKFGWMNPRVQLQSKRSGIAQAQLDPTSSYRQSDVEGLPKYVPTFDTLTGQSDPLQHIATAALSSVYDPFASEGKRFSGGVAFDGIERGKASYDAARGLPEYGRQAGKNLADNPVVAPLAGAANVLATGAGAVPSALAYAFEKVGSEFLKPPRSRRLQQGEPATPSGASVALGEMADENLQNLKAARADLEQQIVQPDVARAGENLGMVAQAFSPLSAANLAASGVAKAVRGAVAGMVKRGAQAAERAAPAGRSMVGDLARDAARLFTETPSALVAPGESGTSVRSGVAAMRAAPEVYERKMYEDILGKLKAATGASDEEVQALDSLAASSWHTPEARIAAVQQDPRMAKVFEVLQPYQIANAEAAFGGRIAPDPFHPQYGQDISQSQRFKERFIGHQAVNDSTIDLLEQQKDVGAPIPSQSLQGVPGVDAAMMQRMQAGEIVPRRGRSMEDTRATLAQTRLAPARLQELQKLGAAGGIAKTARRVEEGKGLGRKALYQSVFDDWQMHRDAKPSSWMGVDQYAKMHGINAPIVGEEGLNVIREGTGDFNMTEDWANKLRANDDVLLRVVPDEEYNIVDFESRPTGQHRVEYRIPQSLAPQGLQSGMIVDRRVAQALHESVNPSAAMQSADSLAKWLEKAFSASQINKAMTLGRPGFSIRNRMNEVFRVLVHDPAVMSDSTVANLADEVSHSSVGRGGRAVTEFPPNPVTGKPYTVGELHELALSQTGMGRGATQELQGLQQEFPRGAWSELPGGRAIDKAIELGMAPGVASNKAGDAFVKQALFPNVNPRYGAEDAMRLRVFINELKNGVRPSIAGNTTRNLMIDFGDKNALQMAGKSVFPFIKYQSSAGPQMMRMILDNPNRFPNAYRFAKYMEHEDARTHGGTAINAKYKSVADMLGGAPVITDTATTARAWRPDTPAAELAGQVENIGKVMDSDAKGQGAFEAFIGPEWADVYAMRTGIAPNTGRNVFGVDEDTFKSIKNEVDRSQSPLAYISPRAAMAGALMERQQRENAAGINTSYFGAHPQFGYAYEVMKGLPLVSRPFASDPWNLAARAYGGGSNPASRAQETSRTMMERALTSYLTGLRSSTIDYPQVAARVTKQQERALPKPVEQSIKRKAMQGRIGNP